MLKIPDKNSVKRRSQEDNKSVFIAQSIYKNLNHVLVWWPNSNLLPVKLLTS